MQLKWNCWPRGVKEPVGEHALQKRIKNITYLDFFDQFWSFIVIRTCQNIFSNWILPFFLLFPQKNSDKTPNINHKSPKAPSTTPTWYQDQEHFGSLSKMIFGDTWNHWAANICDRTTFTVMTALGQPVPSSDGSHLPSPGAELPQIRTMAKCCQAQPSAW